MLNKQMKNSGDNRRCKGSENARAIADYKRRRIQRLRARFDADGDDDSPNAGGNANKNNNGGRRAAKGGHGNTKIPFGLCEREGIKVDPKWTPRDAWEALEGKGYNAGESYAELRKTGKISGEKKAAAKKPPAKIEERHFPEAMISKAYKKNTMDFVNYVNEHCDDGNITEFMSAATLPGAHPAPSVKCKRLASGEGCAIVTSLKRLTKEPIETEVRIPMLSAYKDEETKAEAIRSFCHEWTHYIDFLARDDEKKFGHFTEQSKEFLDAISKFNQESIGPEVKKTFDDFNRRYDELVNEYKVGAKLIGPELAKAMFGDNRPDWINKNGEVDYWATGSASKSYFTDEVRRKKYAAALKKAQKAWISDNRKQRRAIMDGVSCLQGIYDSLSGGELQANKVVKYGHSRSYFKSNPGNKAIEAIADYVALKATNPKLASMFAQDQPDIARAMDGAIVNLTKKLRGEGV